MTRGLISLSVLFLLPLGACDPASLPSVAAVRDSAGITLVDNHPGEAPLRYIARLDSSYVRIGVLEGDPAYIFSSIAGLRVLDGGGVLVAEGQAKEIRVYDASGLHVRTFGGSGDGPGEFAALSDLVQLAGDTVWVWDDQNTRLTSFLTNGELIGTVAGQGADPRDLFGRIGELHRLSDGTYVAETSWISGLRDIPTESSDRSLVRDSIVLRHLDAALQEVDTIAILPGSESLREIRVETSGQRLVSISMSGTARPFGRGSYYHPRLQGVVTATNDSFEWMLRALDGTVQLISRVPDFDRPISAGQITDLRKSLMSMDPSPERTRQAE